MDYGTETDRCDIFDFLVDAWVRPKRVNYLLRDVNFKTTQNGVSNDQSLNYCNEYIKTAFQPEFFKLGNPTPGKQNDCSGRTFFLGNRLDFKKTAQAAAEDNSKRLMNIDGESGENMCVPAHSSPALLKSKIYEDYQEDVSVEKKECEMEVDLEDSEIAIVESELKEANERKKQECPDDAVNEWEKIDSFDENWLSVLEQENLHKHLPMDFISANKKNIKSWLEFIITEDKPQSRYGCSKCRKYFKKANISLQYKNKLIDGRVIKEKSLEDNREIIYQHPNTASHLAVEAYQKREAHGNMKKKLAECEEKANKKLNNQYTITGDMMKLVYHEVKLNIPIYHHPTLVNLMESLGVNLGYHHYDTRGAWRMAEHISDQMHLEFIKFLKADTSPLAIVVDSATDPSQNHYLCIYIQTLHQNKPKVFLYRVPQLGSQETAAGLQGTMEAVFKTDGITEIIKKRLIAFVADGASVNLGQKGGLAIKLEEFVGRKVVKVHCLAHRLNLAVRKVLNKDFNWIFHVESAIKQVHTFFYNKGHKRKSILREFMKGVRATFGGDFQIRWTAAEKKAIANILKHYTHLIGALKEMGKIILDNGKEGAFAKDGNTRNTANGMVKTLTNKNLVLILHFLRDILDVLETSSLEFQKRYGILVDQGKNIEALTTTLRKIGNHNGGYYVETFLDTCICGEEKCGNLRKCERGEEVEYKGIKLKTPPTDRRGPTFPVLSDVGKDIVTKLIDEIYGRIPKKSMALFDVLNPLSWPSDEQYPFNGYIQYREKDLVALHRVVFEGQDLNEEELRQSWRDMLGKLTNDKEWCKMLKSKDLVILWQHYLSTDLIPPKMKVLIRSVLAIPIGSADVERAFSILSHIRDQRRSQLTASHIEGLLRVRINGPNPANFLPLKYAKTWKGMNTGDPLRNRKNKKENKENVIDDSELVLDATEEEVQQEKKDEDDFFGDEEFDQIDTTGMKSKDFKYMDESTLF